MWRTAVSIQRTGVLLLLIGLLCACAVPTENPAVNSSDQFAWNLFVAINQPIPNDPEDRVVWEGWALAREVFADPNATPDWDTLTTAQRSIEQFDPMPLQQLMADPNASAMPAFDPEASPLQLNETRMNPRPSTLL